MKKQTFRKYRGEVSIKAQVWKLICKNSKDKGYADLSYVDILAKLHLPNEKKPSVQKALKLLTKDGLLTITGGESHRKSRFFPNGSVKNT